jgi:phage terminase large subunit-like protein
LTKQELVELDRLLASEAVQPDVVDWIEREYYIPETGQPMQLADYQKRVLREALRVDALGNYVYSTILWGDIKKSAKSSITAAVAMWMAATRPWASVKVVANDLKQADSREAAYMRNAIKLNPRLRETVKVTPSGYKIEFPNNSRIEAVPVDPKGEAGGNDDMIIFTELWAAKNDAAKTMWTEMTPSPTKFGRSFRWVETYAGFDGESPILQPLYERIVQDEFRLDPELEIYADHNSRTFALWNTVPRLSWQTAEYYAQEAPNLTPSEFDRIHRNRWSKSVSTFITGEWWDALKRDSIPVVDPDESWVIALDAASSNDNFGMVALARHPDNPAKAVVRYARRWVPPKDGKINFQGTEENPGPEKELIRLCEAHNVVEVTYDPYQLEDMAGRLKRDPGINFKAFDQNKTRLIADFNLQKAILARSIEHTGEPELREHLLNARAKQDGEERSLRIVKGSDSSRKVDLAVCLSMAYHELFRLNLG